jgi:hypothetical protein
MPNEREQACDCGSLAIAMFDLTVSAMARVGNSIITENSSERTIESSTNMTKKTLIYHRLSHSQVAKK